MSKVEILRLKGDGSQEIAAKGVLRVDGRVELEGDEKLVRQLETRGVLDTSVKPPKRVYPTDGERFIRALEGAFKSGYLTAKVEE